MKIAWRHGKINYTFIFSLQQTLGKRLRVLQIQADEAEMQRTAEPRAGTRAAAVAISLEKRKISSGPEGAFEIHAGLTMLAVPMLILSAMIWVDSPILMQNRAGRDEMDGPVFQMKGDPRMNRVGRLIRRTGPDELPQLINVLKENMRLVGLRPALPQPNDLEGMGRSRHLQYIQDRRFRLDWNQMAQTIPAVLEMYGE